MKKTKKYFKKSKKCPHGALFLRFARKSRAWRVLITTERIISSNKKFQTKKKYFQRKRARNKAVAGFHEPSALARADATRLGANARDSVASELGTTKRDSSQ